MPQLSRLKKLAEMSWNYICAECAGSVGWRWPEGHVATFHDGKCDGCNKHKALSSRNDWLRRPGKTKISLAEWD